MFINYLHYYPTQICQHTYTLQINSSALRLTYSIEQIMVGTHVDQDVCNAKHLEGISDRIQNKFGKSICKKLFFVSCETGDNISALKEYCYHLALKAQLTGDKIPATYLALENRCVFFCMWWVYSIHI